MRERLGWVGFATGGVLLVVLAVSGVLYAQGPASSVADERVTVGYQGVLSDSEGRPLTGTHAMQARLYGAEIGGSALWVGERTEVQVSNGLFHLYLPVARALLNGRALWLSLAVDGELLNPRQLVLPVPYAAGLLPGALASGATDGETIRLTNTGSGNAIWAGAVAGSALHAQSVRGSAVFGEQVGTQQGVGHGGYFTSTTGVGVYGYSGAEASASEPRASEPRAPGVYGHSANGYGVYGLSEAYDGSGVRGEASTGSGVAGRSQSGYALWGLSPYGLGLWAESEHGTGARVHSGHGQGLFVSAAGEDTAAHALVASAAGGQALQAQSARNSAISATSGSVAGAPSIADTAGIVGLGEVRGVYGASRQGPGVEGASTDGYGLRGSSVGNYAGYLVSEGYRGLYVASQSPGFYDAFFGGARGVYIHGDLLVGGSKSGYVVDVALNDGPDPLLEGDVVEIVGVAMPVIGDIPVPRVRRAASAASVAVLGVVDRAYSPAEESSRTTSEPAAPEGFAARAEAGQAAGVEPGAYLGVVTHGAFRSVRVDASYGAIWPGDLLVSSPTPGHAMRAAVPQPGTVVGKALGALEEGVGVIAAIVTLQ